ncbi:MAG: LD-carboxypeptidase [Candidatus Melainabacteria bacterium]|nr:LD-carboxypeptidase [Candidatus Melainabacteria bacterium]
MNTSSETLPLVKPSVLKRGDKIGIVAPASPSFEEGKLEFAMKRFSELGLIPVLGDHLFDSLGDLAGSDKDRASDLNRFFQDKQIKAILAIRGGNGSARLLPLLDWDAIAANPKIIMGYSDITALLLAIHQKTGLVTFHGPTASSFFESPYTCEYFLKAVMQQDPIGEIADPKPKEWAPDYPPTRMILTGGQAVGQITGGCLTLIKQLMGTRYEIETENKILFIEDVSEEPHSIDRMITQLDLAGKFDHIKGLIIGECVGCKPGASKRERMSLSVSIERIFKERFSDFHAPVVYGMRLGHSSEKMTLPLGLKARLVANKNKQSSNVVLSIEEAAVSP